MFRKYLYHITGAHTKIGEHEGGVDTDNHKSIGMNKFITDSTRAFPGERFTRRTSESSQVDAAVGVLCGVSDDGESGLFVGVTANGSVIVEEWKRGETASVLAVFDLNSLPANQEHQAVDGWNMLRVQLSGSEARVWWNPTHADAPGFGRGQRECAKDPSSKSCDDHILTFLATCMQTLHKVYQTMSFFLHNLLFVIAYVISETQKLQI